MNVDSRLMALREIWVATASPRGRPDAVPGWFWWDGEVVYFTCAAQARKARNIAHEPEVVLHNGDGTDAIVIKGRAERVTERDDLERVDQAYRAKYIPHDLSGHEAAVICESAEGLIRQPALLRKIDAAAASVSQCPDQHCCQHGRVQRMAHRVGH